MKEVIKKINTKNNSADKVKVKETKTKEAKPKSVEIKELKAINPLLLQLESFGLTENEAKIYLYLLETGRDAGGSKIAIGTKLHRQYVYNALPKLLDLGLVVEIEKGLQSKYAAAAPSQIEKIIKKKAVQASELVEQLKKVSKVGFEQDFEVHVGQKAMVDYEYNYAKNAKHGESQYIIGGDTKGFSDIMGEDLDNYLAEQTSKKVKVFYVGPEKEKHLWADSVLKDNNMEVRLLETFPLNSTHMVIRDGETAFFSFLNPPLVYVIKSEVIANNYKDFFMMLWNMAAKELGLKSNL